MKKITFLTLITVVTLFFNPVSVSGQDSGQQIVFDWETVTFQFNGYGWDASETDPITGITVEVTSLTTFGLFLNTWYGDNAYGGVVGNALRRSDLLAVPVIFTFSEPVDVHSILTIEGAWLNLNYIFTTTDGDNAAHMVSFTNSDGIASESPVNLNWVGVTSFTVTPSGGTGPDAGKGSMVFDHLTVSPTAALSVADDYSSQNVKVYPNPVENSLTIKNVTGLKSIAIYSSLGQLVLESKESIIDVSELSKGMYFLQIHTDTGVETKRVIKE